METITRKCRICEKPHTNTQTDFCSEACFEVWWEEIEAALLMEYVVMILKESDANTSRR